MRPYGYSTGAVAFGDFREALRILSGHPLQAIELSALRSAELPELLAALDGLDLGRCRHVSLHAPSSFEPEDEPGIVETLAATSDPLPVVVHPDAIDSIERWRTLGSRVLIENMDRRKPRGRTAEDLAFFFEALPEAGLCFDIGHARQVDSSMTEALRILDRFGDRLRELHVSSVGSDSRHYRLDFPTFEACRELSDRVPESVPVIIESRVEESEVGDELRRAREALEPVRMAVASAG
jgi:hypothetical protein